MNRCPECGSWERQCGSDTPVPDCRCVRCASVEIERLRDDLGRYRALYGGLCFGETEIGQTLARVRGERNAAVTRAEQAEAEIERLRADVRVALDGMQEYAVDYMRARERAEQAEHERDEVSLCRALLDTQVENLRDLLARCRPFVVRSALYVTSWPDQQPKVDDVVRDIDAALKEQE